MPRYRVLVVEDEHIIRKNIVDKVNRASEQFYVCADVSSGMEAWNIIRSHPPHVVFVDINIPEIDGLKLVSMIKSTYPKIITVIISGYSKFEYAQQAVGYGVTEYLLKPVKQDSIDDVLGKIKLSLDEDSINNTRDSAYRGGNSDLSLIALENTGNTKDIARRVENYIDDNYYNDISIEEIARTFAFSQTYLTKIFKKHCGITPLKYLISLRIERAKHLFATQPEIEVREVARIVGYDDQHYFSRLFKSIVGKSPSEYRQTLAE